MGSNMTIPVCTEADIQGKTLHSELVIKAFPYPPPPRSLDHFFSDEFCFKFTNKYNIQLTDQLIRKFPPEPKTAQVCKDPGNQGYYFSDDALKSLRGNIYRVGGPAYGSFNSFVGLQLNSPWEAVRNHPGMSGWKAVFPKALKLSAIFTVVLAVPFESVENYYAVQDGDRTVGEGIADGVTDVGIGFLAGAAGIAAGAKIGAALGTVIAPGLGTAVGWVAGGVIGAGVGFFLDEVKDQVVA